MLQWFICSDEFTVIDVGRDFKWNQIKDAMAAPLGVAAKASLLLD